MVYKVLYTCAYLEVIILLSSAFLNEAGEICFLSDLTILCCNILSQVFFILFVLNFFPLDHLRFNQIWNFIFTDHERACWSFQTLAVVQGQNSIFYYTEGKFKKWLEKQDF